MWARLSLVVSLFTESKEMVAGGKQKQELSCGSMGPCGPGPFGPPWGLMGRALIGLPGPSWAGPSWAGPLWAPLGPYGPGPYGPALMGRAVMGQALMGWALMGRALMGPTAQLF